MASSKWKSFDEINKIIKTRNFVFWGASNWINPTLKKLDINPLYIVDTNPNNDGVIFEGFKVQIPNLKQIKKHNIFIVISTGNYDTLCQDLVSNKLEMGSDFCVTPLLEDRSKKDKLIGYKGKALFCSPQHLFEDDRGGGLYEINLLNGEQKKIFSGKCRTITKYKDGYAVIDMLSGIKILDKNFVVIKTIELPPNCEAHGLFYNLPEDLFYVGCPGNDCVYSLDINSKLISEFRVTEKYFYQKADFHHINDIYVEGNSLFVSMFSMTGNWNHDSYDGAILEFNIKTKTLVGPVIQNLWMPHSITKFQNTLAVLDSMTGRLLTFNKSVELELPGFLRGLDFDDEFALIAVSSHRYPEKVKIKKYPVLMNALLYLIDVKNNMTKTISISGTETIHSVIFK